MPGEGVHGIWAAWREAVEILNPKRMAGSSYAFSVDLLPREWHLRKDFWEVQRQCGLKDQQDLLTGS